MDKRKIELIITGVLALVFLLFLANALMKGSSKKRHAPAPQEERLSKKVIDLIEQRESGRKIINAPLEWGRDPFVLVEDEGSKVASAVIGGIIWDARNPKVIINNEVYKKGDKVGSMEIMDITEDSVLLKEGDETHKIMLD